MILECPNCGDVLLQTETDHRHEWVIEDYACMTCEYECRRKITYNQKGFTISDKIISETNKNVQAN